MEVRTALSQKKLSEEIIDTVLHSIDEGKLQSGDKLPTEKQIAEELGISKTAVREALSALETMGYTKTKKGEGTFVAPMSLESLVLPISIVLHQDADMIKNILELRMIMEPRIAALAAQRISDEQITELKKLHESMLTAVTKGGAASKEDVRFHVLLAQASGNSVLFHIYKICQSAVSGTIEMINAIPGQSKKGYEGHQQILNALCRKDSDKAALQMHKHIKSVVEVYDTMSADNRRSHFVPAG
jgi:GntR family transcriptional repressor for pyruvate dehydrogenase complex